MHSSLYPSPSQLVRVRILHPSALAVQAKLQPGGGVTGWATGYGHTTSRRNPLHLVVAAEPAFLCKYSFALCLAHHNRAVQASCIRASRAIALLRCMLQARLRYACMHADARQTD